jgi:hypothetical protein
VPQEVATYSELRIRFERAPDGHSYLAHASGPAGETEGQFQLPGSKLELENLALKLSRGRNVVRRVDSPELALVRRYGTELFDAVFSGHTRDLYRDSFTLAQGEGKGLRLTLALTKTPELLHVPWEYLYDDPAFLSISTWTPVVRYLDLPRSRPPLPVTQPLRILAMVSSPSDVVSLDVGQERRNLEEALAEVTARGAITIRWLEKATLRELQRELRRGAYHVFHFIGHGGYDTSADDGVLLLEDELGHSRRISGMQLGTMLADETALRLAVLNSCEGARTSSDDPYAGVATSLIQREVPAVVAMQFEITDRAAIVFGGEFYAALADGYPVDSALAEARKAIFADQNDVEWGTPVLYMRVPDGRIFDVTAAPQIERSAPEPPPPVEEEPPPGPQIVEPPPVEPVRERTPERVPSWLSAIGFASTLLLLLGILFPWDYHEGFGEHRRKGRSWMDLHFDVPVSPHTGVVTALSAAVLVAGAVAALLLARHPRTRMLAAGLMIGFGATGAVKYGGVLGHAITNAEPAKNTGARPESILVFIAVVAGACLLVGAGIRLARLAGGAIGEQGGRVTARIPASLLAGAVLIFVGTGVPFNGGGASSDGTRVGRRSIIPDEQGALWLDPVAVGLGTLVLAFVLWGSRSVLVAGILIAIGLESAALWIRYVVVPLLVEDGLGSFAPGGLIGLLGALLVLGAGLRVLREAQSATASPGPLPSG